MNLPRIIENMIIGNTVKMAYVKTLPHDASFRPILFQSNKSLLLVFPLLNI